MLYLLIAVVLCLLLPQLPVWMYRRLPRRPPPPMSEEELRSLDSQLRPTGPPLVAEVVADDSPPTDIMRPFSSAPTTSTGNAARTEQREEPLPANDKPAVLAAEKKPVPRLSLSSYRWLQFLSVPSLIVTFLSLGAGFALLFHYLGEQRARSFPPAIFLFKPFSYGIVCGVPALFLGIFCSLPLLTLLARLFMGHRRFLEYLFWDEGYVGSQKLDARIRFLTIFGSVLSVFCALFVLLVMNWYARFDDDEIAIKRFIGFGEEIHPYDSVEQIVVSSHSQVGKEIVRGEDLGIRFGDGRTWKTDQTFHMPCDVGERDRLLKFLQRKTGKPIVRVRLLSEAPGW